MAKIKVSFAYEIYDGISITFKAPCDCSEIDGLNVYTINGPQSFIFCDAHGNNLSDLEELFLAGTYIQAVLNTTDGIAYILNADTNQYLEGKLATKADLDETGKIPLSQLPLSDYTLPVAGTETLGGIKVGNGLNIDADGVLSLALSDGDEVSY